MSEKSKIVVIIPAYNEENSIAKVIRDIPAGLVNEIIVVNNNSNDATNENARNAGATVLHEHRPGYGFACLKGIEYAKELQPLPDIVVFIDADYSDFPEEITKLVQPIISAGMDLVIGSRKLGKKEKGSMTVQQEVGNIIATKLLKLIYKVHYTDLGPFRAIRFDKLMEINMKDTTYGWTVEMQLKAAKFKMKIVEVPVSYRKRIGKSKISGTVKGTLLAGYKIITTIFKYR
ncbi:glycosyltransferase family 2 protein [Daejeonella sp.]|uniref:glycosyltransferase family 2 protein n=1 Tax=Daejeonella sp. TaxID=2805397 RepID=UPI0030C40C5A